MTEPKLAQETNPYQPVWKALLKSAGFVALWLGSVMAVEILASIVLMVQGSLDADAASSKLVALTYELMFMGGGLFFLITAVIYLFRPRHLRDATGLKKCRPAYLGTALLLGFGAFFAASRLMEIMNFLPAVQQSTDNYSNEMQQIEEVIVQQGNPWVDVLYTVIGAPLVEEILCRGLVLRQVRRSAPDWLAILISALTFAWLHQNLFQGIFTLLLGGLLGYVAIKFDSVLPAILIHVAFNGSNYLVDLWYYVGLDSSSKAAYWIHYGGTVFCIVAGICGVILLIRFAKKTPPLERNFPRDPNRVVPPVTPPQTWQQPNQTWQQPNQTWQQPNQTWQQPNQTWQQPNQTWATSGTSYPAAPMTQPVQQQGVGQNMAAPEFLIVGLGNPGKKYESTRHNAGFIALDYIAIRENVKIMDLRFRGLSCDVNLNGHKALFLKPQTFMNLSGESVREAAAYYRIPPEKILVLVDDVNFDPGVIRIRREGSAGGHNGLKSIIDCLGTESFPRVRLGVGQLPPERDLVSWVLGAMPDGDMDALLGVLENVRQTVLSFVSGDLEGAMSAYNARR